MLVSVNLGSKSHNLHRCCTGLISLIEQSTRNCKQRGNCKEGGSPGPLQTCGVQVVSLIEEQQNTKNTKKEWHGLITSWLQVDWWQQHGQQHKWISRTGTQFNWSKQNSVAARWGTITNQIQRQGHCSENHFAKLLKYLPRWQRSFQSRSGPRRPAWTTT